MGKLAPLARSALGRGLQIPDVCRLAKHFTACQLKAGEALFSKGQDADGLYLICKGSLSLADADPLAGKGAESVLDLQQGEVLGELSLLREGKRLLSAKASKKTTLLLLNRKNYQRLGQEAPQTQAKFAHNVLRLICDKCIAAKEALPAFAK